RMVDTWHDDRANDLPHESLRTALTAGVYQRIRGTLPRNAWTADEQTFRKAIRSALHPQYVADAFDNAYRYFALGKVLLKDEHYHVHDLTSQSPADQLWHVISGPVTIEPRAEAACPVAVLHYDFGRTDAGRADSLEVAALLDLPVPFIEFKR